MKTCWSYDRTLETRFSWVTALSLESRSRYDEETSSNVVVSVSVAVAVILRVKAVVGREAPQTNADALGYLPVPARKARAEQARAVILIVDVRRRESKNEQANEQANELACMHTSRCPKRVGYPPKQREPINYGGVVYNGFSILEYSAYQLSCNLWDNAFGFQIVNDDLRALLDTLLSRLDHNFWIQGCLERS